MVKIPNVPFPFFGGPESHFTQPSKGWINIHNGNKGCILAVATTVEIKKSQRRYLSNSCFSQ